MNNWHGVRFEYLICFRGKLGGYFRNGGNAIPVTSRYGVNSSATHRAVYAGSWLKSGAMNMLRFGCI